MKKKLKKALIKARNGAFITPLISQLMVDFKAELPTVEELTELIISTPLTVTKMRERKHNAKKYIDIDVAVEEIAKTIRARLVKGE